MAGRANPVCVAGGGAVGPGGGRGAGCRPAAHPHAAGGGRCPPPPDQVLAALAACAPVLVFGIRSLWCWGG